MNDPREFEAEENDDLWGDVDESELLVACELAAGIELTKDRRWSPFRGGTSGCG